MVRHKDQRVGVFVDVQNMYYSAKHLYNTKVNFNAILKEAVAGRSLIRAFCYVVKADMKEESHFFDALEKIGFEVRIKELQTFYGGAKKGDWDVGLAMDMIRMAPKLDVVVLVSGDGDFVDLLSYVQASGCRAEAIAFGKSASSKLKVAADLFIDMDRNPGKYLIRSLRRSIQREMPAEKTETAAEKSAEKPAAKPADKPAAKPLAKPAEKSQAKQGEK